MSMAATHQRQTNHAWASLNSASDFMASLSFSTPYASLRSCTFFCGRTVSILLANSCSLFNSLNSSLSPPTCSFSSNTSVFLLSVRPVDALSCLFRQNRPVRWFECISSWMLSSAEGLIRLIELPNRQGGFFHAFLRHPDRFEPFAPPGLSWWLRRSRRAGTAAGEPSISRWSP